MQAQGEDSLRGHREGPGCLQPGCTGQGRAGIRKGKISMVGEGPGTGRWGRTRGEGECEQVDE